MNNTVIKIISLVGGKVSPFDNQYLVEYDPLRPGLSPDGRPMTAHIVTTPDVEQATRYTAKEAFEMWRATSGRTRPDGKPDRPLTAFNVEITVWPPLWSTTRTETE